MRFKDAEHSNKFHLTIIDDSGILRERHDEILKKSIMSQIL